MCIRDMERTWTQEADRLGRRSGLGQLDLSAARGGGSEPPVLTNLFETMGEVLANLRLINESKATYIRGKTFTSAMLFVSGFFPTLRIQLLNRCKDHRPPAPKPSTHLKAAPSISKAYRTPHPDARPKTPILASPCRGTAADERNVLAV